MNRNHIDDEPTEAWLVEATRQLDDTGVDTGNLISAITANLGKVRRPGRPLATDIDSIAVSDRVLKQVLSVKIRDTLGRLIVFISVEGAGGSVDGIRIGLIARYHDTLQEDADLVREVTTDVVADLLGPEVGPLRIDVRWQDLDTREWLT